jgi:hypothetical protein
MKDAGKLLMTTIIRDKLLAITGLIGIGLKTAFEWFFKIDIAKPWQHDVTEEQFNEIIRVFELLQNEYLTDSDLEPVKVGNEWTKEELIFPSIETLEKELTEIFIMNKTYIDKRFEVVENEPKPPEPSPEEINLAHDITDMLITDPVSIQKQIEPVEVAEPIEVEEPVEEQSLTEEEEKILKELIELRDYFIKLESEDNYIMTPYPDLPSTEPISDNTNRPIVPDIEKDIKDAKQSSILDIPDVDDVYIQQNTDRPQDLKPNEIKNKMEL